MSFKEAENNSQCYEEDTGLGSQRCSREREKKKLVKSYQERPSGK